MVSHSLSMDSFRSAASTLWILRLSALFYLGLRTSPNLGNPSKVSKKLLVKVSWQLKGTFINGRYVQDV